MIELHLPNGLGTSAQQLATNLLQAHAASRVGNMDPTLWGANAQAEAEHRLGWVDLPLDAPSLLDEIDEVLKQCRATGLTRVLLAGMGGSSLAPEVIAHAAGVELTVLDSTHPEQVRHALVDLAKTVVVIASKSGSTIETDAARRILWDTYLQAGIDPAPHFIAITDPGSELSSRAHAEAWLHVFHANPNVGGRFSALSVFGLLPAALAGADVATIVADALAARELLLIDSVENPAVQLAAFATDVASLGSQCFYVRGTEPTSANVGVWVEQLVAESTGKNGTGLLPIAELGTPNGAQAARIALSFSPLAPDHNGAADMTIHAPLGAQFMLWEFATALMGYLCEVNPFDQPNVEAAKVLAREVLAKEDPLSPFPYSVTVGGLELCAATALDNVTSLSDFGTVIADLVAAEGTHGYIAVQAFADRISHPELAQLRFASAVHAPGFGPRYLHSTGQYHKGGYPSGVFVQILDDTFVDLPIPGQNYTFGALMRAQADGDAAVLLQIGRPVMRIRIVDRDSGIRQLVDTFGPQQ